MASLYNSGYSSSLNNGSYLNQGGADQLFSTVNCIATVNATLAQSSILDPTGFRKDLKVVTAKKQIIVKGI